MFLKMPFHLVTLSPWPLLASANLFLVVFSLIYWVKTTKILFFLFSLLGILAIMSLWWRDVIRESTFQGNHNMKVMKGLRIGFILFIVSEVMFFFSFFWAFFHSALVPAVEVGGVWPPTGVVTFNPSEVALLNTLILLSSGITVTWAHHSIVEGKWMDSLISLSITVILGSVFLGFQGFEYYDAPFTIQDSIYGSLFFVMTGFHGLHVMVGTIFLMVALCRTYSCHFLSDHHLGFEMAAWYWHFVDVVWLFLYICVYWWGYTG